MVTTIIIILNIIMFLFMIISGVNPISPSAESIYLFGGNFGPAISSGEYWRLLLSNYIHIGAVHLLFNMWCLYSLGIELEEVLGQVQFIILYTSSGIIGSVSSFYFNYNSIGAGASGAIFGLAGALLVLIVLLKRKFSNSGFSYSSSPLLFFISYNIFYGFLIPGIDNAAHIGGLITGLIVGLFLIQSKVLHLN